MNQVDFVEDLEVFGGGMMERERENVDLQLATNNEKAFKKNCKCIYLKGQNRNFT